MIDRGLAYDKVDFKVWTHPDGDSFARCWVRLQETRVDISHGGLGPLRVKRYFRIASFNNISAVPGLGGR